MTLPLNNIRAPRHSEEMQGWSDLLMQWLRSPEFPGDVDILGDLSVTGNATIGAILQAATAKIGDVDGGNYSEFEEDGTLVFKGAATVWDDLPPIPVIVAKPGGVAPTLTNFVGNIQQYTFAVNDIVYGAQEILHGYEEGTDFDIHVHWGTNGTDGTDRFVKWELEYSLANLSSVAPFANLFPSSTVISGETVIPANTGDRAHIYSDLADVSGINIEIGAYFVYRFRRIAASGAAPSNNPFGLAVGFHIRKDTVGSRQELVK